MLTYKKKSGDAPTTNIRDRVTLLQLWEQRKGRVSPPVSDDESEDQQHSQQQQQQQDASEEDFKLTAEMMANATAGMDGTQPTMLDDPPGPPPFI